MRIIIALAVLILASMQGSSLAASSCPTAVLTEGVDVEHCFCGSELKNMKVTLLPPLKIIAACYPDPGTDIKHGVASLESVLPFEDLFLGGELKSSGEFLYAPSEDGSVDAKFIAIPPLAYPHDSDLADILGRLDFSTEEAVKKFHMPKSMIKTSCAIAHATVSIKGISINFAQNDSRGAAPSDFEVLKVTAFKKCSPQRKVHAVQPGVQADVHEKP